MFFKLTRIKILGAALPLTALACASANPQTRSIEPTQRPLAFVSLHDIDSTIVLDLRYFGSHNFIGQRILGYKAEKCLLTQPAAQALKAAQDELRPYGLSLKVYDCYRPQRAVDTFIAWAENKEAIKMKAEFFPRIAKEQLFLEGYLAKKSGHSRGSAVDLTIVPLPVSPQETYREGDALRDCTLPAAQRFGDNSLDFGTGYDCFDARANSENPTVNSEHKVRRLMLRALLEKHGFRVAKSEWWHFTLQKEPYPKTYFDFEVE